METRTQRCTRVRAHAASIKAPRYEPPAVEHQDASILVIPVTARAPHRDEEIGRLDDETRLVDFGLGKIARHGILLRYGFEENPIIITVCFEKIPFDISIGLFRDTSVLYQYVSKAAGLSVSNFDIIYKGKELRAGKSLSSHGITNQSKLEVNFKQIEYSTKTRNQTG